MSNVKIIGVPLDLGAGRRGVDMGPSAMRIAGVAENIRKLGYDVIDGGDIAVIGPEVQKIEDNRLKYLPEITRTVIILCKEVEQTMENGELPLVLGGDHSMAIGTISGVSNYYKKRNQKFGLIWVDAHADANTSETTPSGNIHGMPHAVVFGRGAKQLVEVGGFKEGESRLNPKNGVLVGARDIDEKEKNILKEIGITIFSMEKIDRIGIHEVMREALEIVLNGTDAIHLSFDVDSLDPSDAPGVGTPVRGGLTYREAHTMMELISDSGKLRSMEVAEVNPILDIKNSTAEVAVELIASALGKRII
jgi:arginase